MSDAVCEVVCVCVSFASEVGVCFGVALPAWTFPSIFNPSSNLLLLTVPRRYSCLHLCFGYVSRDFLTSRCMSDAVCAVVCVCVSFASEVGV